MQRTEKGSSNHDRFQSQMELSMTTGTNTTYSNCTSRRKRKSKNCDNLRPWAELPEELLDIISSRLRIPDYLSFSRVCQGWRSYFLASNKRIALSLPPLVCYMSAEAEDSCFFHDITDGNRYEATLPYFAFKSCIGLSCGFIIMEEFFNHLWFINPVTGYQHLFCSMPQRDFQMYRSDRFILASTGSSQDILILVLSRRHYCLWFRRSIDVQWSAYSFVDKLWACIMDIVVFKARVFTVTRECRIGILSLRSSNVMYLELRHPPARFTNAKFVISNEQLFVVDFMPLVQLAIYRIDFQMMAWVRVDDLGDQALFLGDMNGTGMRSTTRWGGRSNCVYYLPSSSTYCLVYSITNAYIESVYIGHAEMKCWYFSDQSHSLDYVRDE